MLFENRTIFFQMGDFISSFDFLEFHLIFNMAAPKRTVLKSLNAINFHSFYPVLIKFAPKCMACQGLSSQIHFASMLPFPLLTILCKDSYNLQ